MNPSKSIPFLLSSLLLLLLLVACAAPAPLRHGGTLKVAPPVPAPTERSTPPSTGAVQNNERLAPSQPETTRRIVYDANLTLVVVDARQVADQIAQIAEEMGGYVSRSTLYRSDGQLAGSITVRVPQKRFDEAMQRFRRLAVRVDRESLRTNDVTQEYVDLQARLKNLEATEQELRTLLSEVRKRSQRASDIMEVYQELTRVRGDIEQIQGRLQMLDKLTTLATITITLSPYELSRPLNTHWDPRFTLRQAWGTLLRGFQLLADLAIYLLVVVLPLLGLILLPIALVIYAIRRLIRHRGTV